MEIGMKIGNNIERKYIKGLSESLQGEENFKNVCENLKILCFWTQKISLWICCWRLSFSQTFGNCEQVVPDDKSHSSCWEITAKLSLLWLIA